MKVIETKYHGPTDRRGAWVAAKAEGLKAVYLPWDHNIGTEENHDRAALAFADKLNWSSDRRFQLARGGLPSGKGNVYVILDKSAIVRRKGPHHARSR
jgi:hypothetical protein